MRIVVAVLLCAVAVLADINAEDNISKNLRGVEEEAKLPPCDARGLVLSGGGDKGAYQAGVIKVLAEHARDVKPNWKYIAGVSVGAINGAGISMFPVGQEAEAAEFLQKMWFDLKKSDVYVGWSPGGQAQGLLAETSLYDSRPLSKYLGDRMDVSKIKNSGRLFYAGAVAVETGEFVSFRNDEEDILQGVLGSAMEPLVFSPIAARGLTFLDGGIKSITPIQSLIENVKRDAKCQLTDVDVVICHPADNGQVYVEVNKMTTIPLNMRVLDLLEDNANDKDMFAANVLYKDTTKFTIVSPPFALKTKIMEFAHDDTVRMFDLGLDDATNVLEHKTMNDPHRCLPKDEEANKANRSVKVTIKNNFSREIQLFGHDAEDDGFTTCQDKPLFKSMPCHKIAKGESCVFSTHSMKMLRGTEGHAYYRYNDNVDNVIKVHWDNPYFGSFSHDCNILGSGVTCQIERPKGGDHAEIIVNINP